MTSRPPAPKVFPPYPARRAIALPIAFIRSLLPASGKNPTLKLLIALLLLINWSSFPLVWHVRLFWQAYRIRAAQISRPSIFLPFLRNSSAALTTPGIEPRLRVDKLPLGKDIFEDHTHFPFTAHPGDCDWNMHLSNSSYGKILDYARMQHLYHAFVRSGSDGAFFALGGATYTFHREIPLGAHCEIEVGLHAWDDKWLYLLARFVSPTVSRSITRSKSAQSLKALARDVAAGPRGPLTETKAIEEQPNGSKTIYATAVSRYCFKERAPRTGSKGRRTIPPWIVIAMSGYGTFASTRTNWTRAETLRRDTLSAASRKLGGKALPKDNILLGGGAGAHGLLTLFGDAVEKGEEWTKPSSWELAEFETRRLRNLASLHGTAGRMNL